MSPAKFTPDAQQAPADAFVFEAAEVQFAEPTQRTTNGIQKMAVEVLARTGKPVYHWYWDWIVHDFEGMKHKPSIAFDYRHDPDEPLGYANKFEIRDGNLWLAGELLSRDPQDQAAKIMDLGPAGVPYEQSIHFASNSVFEYLPEGTQTTVNGMTVTGPLVIVREWELVRCAFCLTGIDGGTQTNFDGEDAQQALASMFSLNWKNPMSKETNTPATQGSDSSAGKDAAAGSNQLSAENTQGGTQGQASQSAAPGVDLSAEKAKWEADQKSRLTKFTEKFGKVDGPTYFADGLSYEQALEKHVEKLEAASQQNAAGKSDAEKKLEQLNAGEETGIDTGSGKGKQVTKWEDLFASAK